MTLQEIYTQIMVQSGIEMINTFSNSIPYCFKDAFTETLRIPKSKDSFQPYFEDEITPLIEFENKTIPDSHRIVLSDISISTLDYVPINVFDVVTNTNVINFKYVGFNEINDISDNPNLFPSLGEGYWTKNSSRIRILTTGSHIQIVYIRNPVISDWENSSYDFVEAGYGISFLNSVIELAIEKIIVISKRRGL